MHMRDKDLSYSFHRYPWIVRLFKLQLGAFCAVDHYLSRNEHSSRLERKDIKTAHQFCRLWKLRLIDVHARDRVGPPPLHVPRNVIDNRRAIYFPLFLPGRG